MILGAGSAERFGAPKQLARFNGLPLLQHVLDAAATSQVRPIVLVLGANADALRAGLTLPAGTTVAVNNAFAAGQSSSLRVGLAALPDDVRRAVILLADEPLVDPEAIRAVASASGGPIVRCSYAGRPGHPIALDRSVWDQLGGEADEGARALIAQRPELVTDVPVSGTRPRDVDTPADLESLHAGDEG